MFNINCLLLTDCARYMHENEHTRTRFQVIVHALESIKLRFVPWSHVRPEKSADEIYSISDTEAVFLLDLDKCAFFGNDANDLGLAMQWMEKDHEKIVSLYRLLVNPSLLETFQILKQRHQTVRVVIYTMRADFLRYHSSCYPTAIPIQWNPDWHDQNQLYFPSHLRSADEILRECRSLPTLDPQDSFGLSKSLERLLIARQVLAEALALPSLPDLVVTAGDKEVAKTVARLGYPLDHAHLWDDNAALQGRPRTVVVPAFDRLPSDQHGRVAEFLHRHLPPAGMPAELVDFLLTARPTDRAVRLQPNAPGGLAYALPSSPCEFAFAAVPWPLHRICSRGLGRWASRARRFDQASSRFDQSKRRLEASCP